MKVTKYFAMLLLMMTASLAFTACSDDDDEEPKQEQIAPVSHDFTGYTVAVASYFPSGMVSAGSTLKVYVVDNQYVVEYHDSQWGDVKFLDVKLTNGQVSGEGELTMSYRGQVGTYKATLSGPMQTPVISLPDVMGGTTLTFHIGEAPAAETPQS